MEAESKAIRERLPREADQKASFGAERRESDWARLSLEDLMAKRSTVLALLAVLLLIGCADTKTQKENEQLKAQVADLQKQVGEMGNRVGEATKARDDLVKENAALRDENNRLKGSRGARKTTKSKRGRRRTA